MAARRKLLKNMARPGGLELPTFWFVARRSIQLSYGRTDTNSLTQSFDAPSSAERRSGMASIPMQLGEVAQLDKVA
jgi:hypothetical protein